MFRAHVKMFLKPLIALQDELSRLKIYGNRHLTAGWVVACLAPWVSTLGIAQDKEFTPPTIDSVDPNGVDVTTGDFAFTTVEVSIGPQDAGGLFHARAYRGGKSTAYWRDANSGTVQLDKEVDGSVVDAVVTYNGASETFDYNGSVYTPRSDAGATLVKSGQIYTFTSRYGEVAHFSQAYTWNNLWVGDAVVTDITRPNGEVITFHYKHITNGVSEINRIQSITNNYGYQIHYEYASDDPGNADVTRRVKAVGINNAYDYCDPLASTCTGFTQSWPQATYSKPSPAATSIASPMCWAKIPITFIPPLAAGRG